MLDAKLVDEMWMKRHSHIFLGEWLNEDETTYLVNLLAELENKHYDCIQNIEIVEAAKNATFKNIPLEDTVKELTEMSEAREDLL